MPRTAQPGHIAHFVSMNPNKRGPVELSLHAVGEAWVQRGGRFSMFFTAPAPDWYREMLGAAGIAVGVVRHETWHQDVIRTCSAIRPDVVHLHMERNTMARQLRSHGIRVVRTEHSGRPHPRTELLRRIVRWQRQWDLDKFVCVSEHLARQTRRDFLAPESKIVVIYNGVDMERFRPRPEERSALRANVFGLDDDARVITVAAHLTKQKRQHLLLEALPIALERSPRTHLVIAGDGPERENLHAMARMLAVEKSVTFLHGDNDVARLYAASDVGALTSVGEGLGGSAVEAQATGLPLIATPDAGLAETFLPERTGIAVDPTPESIAAAMVRLSNDDELRSTMGRDARDFARATFSMQTHVAKMLSFYDELT